MIVTYRWNPVTTDPKEFITATMKNSKRVPCVGENVSIDIKANDKERIQYSGEVTYVGTEVRDSGTEFLVNLKNRF
jgi:hypothetical protein